MDNSLGTALDRCPVEIWIEILSCATQAARPSVSNAVSINAYDHQALLQRAAAIRDILRFTIVSRTWHSFMQPCLYQWIRMRNARKQDPYRLSLLLSRTLNGSSRGLSVRRLVFQMAGPEWLDKRQACLALLSHCTLLEEFYCESPVMVTVHGGGYHVGYDLICTLLHACRNTLRKVYIAGKQMHPVHLYTQLLAQCPRLESLECACWNLEGWPLQVPASACTITEAVRLQSFSWVTGHPAYMAFFSGLHLPNLRKVYIADETTNLALHPHSLLLEVDRFFRLHGSQLLSVELSDGIWLLDRKKGMASAILAHCPNLQEFAFNLYACQPSGLPQSHDHLRRVSCCQLRLPQSSPDMVDHLQRVEIILRILFKYPKLERIRCVDIPGSFTNSRLDELTLEGSTYRTFTERIAKRGGRRGIRFEDKEGQHMAIRSYR